MENGLGHRKLVCWQQRVASQNLGMDPPCRPCRTQTDVVEHREYGEAQQRHRRHRQSVPLEQGFLRGCEHGEAFVLTRPGRQLSDIEQLAQPCPDQRRPQFGTITGENGIGIVGGRPLRIEGIVEDPDEVQGLRRLQQGDRLLEVEFESASEPGDIPFRDAAAGQPGDRGGGELIDESAQRRDDLGHCGLFAVVDERLADRGRG